MCEKVVLPRSVWPTLALAFLLLPGCSNVPDCDPGETNAVDRAFAPLDDAVGALNEDLNGQTGGCETMTGSEAEGYPADTGATPSAPPP